MADVKSEGSAFDVSTHGEVDDGDQPAKLDVAIDRQRANLAAYEARAAKAAGAVAQATAEAEAKATEAVAAVEVERAMLAELEARRAAVKEND
jgi:hypothetical protein